MVINMLYGNCIILEYDLLDINVLPSSFSGANAARIYS